VERPSSPWLRPLRHDSTTYFVLIGRSHGELRRFTARWLPPRSDKMRSVEIRSSEMRWDEWYERSLKCCQLREHIVSPRDILFQIWTTECHVRTDVIAIRHSVPVPGCLCGRWAGIHRWATADTYSRTGPYAGCAHAHRGAGWAWRDMQMAVSRS